MKFPSPSSEIGGNLIDFHFEDVNFDFSQAPVISQWITETVEAGRKVNWTFSIYFLYR